MKFCETTYIYLKINSVTCDTNVCVHTHTHRCTQMHISVSILLAYYSAWCARVCTFSWLINRETSARLKTVSHLYCKVLIIVQTINDSYTLVYPPQYVLLCSGTCLRCSLCKAATSLKQPASLAPDNTKALESLSVEQPPLYNGQLELAHRWLS